MLNILKDNLSLMIRVENAAESKIYCFQFCCIISLRKTLEMNEEIH